MATRVMLMRRAIALPLLYCMAYIVKWIWPTVNMSFTVGSRRLGGITYDTGEVVVARMSIRVMEAVPDTRWKEPK
jgi:hypothetical protein